MKQDAPDRQGRSQRQSRDGCRQFLLWSVVFLTATIQLATSAMELWLLLHK
jgi:hypothetical protein